MTDTNTPNGGPEWERNEAAKLLAAGVKAGDDAVIEQSADRLGDAVVNAVTSRLISTLVQTLRAEVKPQFEQLSGEVKQQVGAISHRLDNSDTARITRNTQFQVQLDNRLDAFAEKQDAMLASVQDGTARLGKIETDIDALHQGYNSNAARIAAIEAYTRANRRAELDTVVHKQQAIEQQLIEHDRQIRGVKEFFATFVSPEEQADERDAITSAANDLRELLALMREERARRGDAS